MSGELTGASRPPRVSITATGDAIGNNATVTVGHHLDGSTSVVIERRQSVLTAWLTRREAVALAALLLRPHVSGESGSSS